VMSDGHPLGIDAGGFDDGIICGRASRMLPGQVAG
jgi:hypothetical protein